MKETNGIMQKKLTGEDQSDLDVKVEDILQADDTYGVIWRMKQLREDWEYIFPIVEKQLIQVLRQDRVCSVLKNNSWSLNNVGVRSADDLQ